MSENKTTCEATRRSLDLLRDGEGPDADAVRAHATSCAACRADAAVAEAVALRLRERGGPEGAGMPPGLRDAVLARIREGEAVLLDLRPFLRRAAVAAAAVFITSSAAAFVQASLPRVAARKVADGDPGISREEILDEIVRPRIGPGR